MAGIRRVKTIPSLPVRPPDGHKGLFGRVLVISGSVGMAGAPSLVANAALRSGAGLVTIASPEPIVGTVAGLCPCATTVVLPANKSGQIKPTAALKLLRVRGFIGDRPQANPPDALVVGPGIGTGSHDYADNFWHLIDAFRMESQVPAVIDADALNLAAGLPRCWDQRAHSRTILTPHPGELSRLLKISTSDIQSDRESTALQAVERFNQATDADHPAVLVLKGAGTVVTDGRSVYVNRTGNPGMATGGSGDVLSGLLGALLGQGMSCLEAAVLGVHVHGLAGDLAARRLGQVSVIATDVIDALPEAFRTLASRANRVSSRSTRTKSRG